MQYYYIYSEADLANILNVEYRRLKHTDQSTVSENH